MTSRHLPAYPFALAPSGIGTTYMYVIRTIRADRPLRAVPMDILEWPTANGEAMRSIQLAIPVVNAFPH
jgi:hypothetical protein